jgi:hypothetical protein
VLHRENDSKRESDSKSRPNITATFAVSPDGKSMTKYTKEITQHIQLVELSDTVQKVNARPVLNTVRTIGDSIVLLK